MEKGHMIVQEVKVSKNDHKLDKRTWRNADAPLIHSAAIAELKLLGIACKL